MRFPLGAARPLEFFEFVGALVRPDQGRRLASWHLVERLCARLAEGAAEAGGLVPLPTLLAALTMTVESSVEDRTAALFRIFSGAGPATPPAQPEMTHEQLEQAIAALGATCQLPVRAMLREFDEYPFNWYERAGPGFLAARALDEVLNARRASRHPH